MHKYLIWSYYYSPLTSSITGYSPLPSEMQSVTTSILAVCWETAAQLIRSASAGAAQLRMACAPTYQFAQVYRDTYLRSLQRLRCLSTFSHSLQLMLLQFRQSPKLNPCSQRNNVTPTQSGLTLLSIRTTKLPSRSRFQQTRPMSTTRDHCFRQRIWVILVLESPRSPTIIPCSTTCQLTTTTCKIGMTCGGNT